MEHCIDCGIARPKCKIRGRCRPCKRKHGLTPAQVEGRKFSTKYPFTLEMDADLETIYRTCKNRKECTNAVRELSKRLVYPSWAFYNRATAIGLRSQRKFVQKGNPAFGDEWKPAELTYLKKFAGKIHIRTLARKMGRSVPSVSHKIYRLGLHQAMRVGYTHHELSVRFGVHDRTVKAWKDSGLIKLSPDGRFDDQEVEQFIIRHMDEYDLVRCDQPWLKSMIQGAIESYIESEERAA